MKRFLTILVLLAVTAGCLWQAGRLNDRLLELRREHHLSLGDPLENTPPMVAFTTVALGGFRGLLADWLWLRAARLQEEGQYFELVQLSKWITTLEPRFAEVWAFHAWNMAYNISVIFQDPADRWRWVGNGISLLRDYGIAYNPGDAELYRELGWFFQHKLAGDYDDAHWHYKRAWAEEMGRLWDGPAPPYAAYTAAPRSRKDLLAIAGMPELVARLEALGIDPFGHDLASQAGRNPDAGALLGSEAGAKLLLYLRVQRMIRDYKLLPEVMREIDDGYGPLDWRLPQAHAIYWAYRGRQFAHDDFEPVAAERMIFQSLADAFRRGSLIHSQEHDLFVARPNLDLLPHVRKAYEKAIKDFPGEATVTEAYRYFLIEAALALYSYHRVSQAQEIFGILRERYPSDETAGGFEPFIYGLLARQMEDLSPHSALALIEGSLFQACFWEAVGDSERALGYRQMAQLCRRQYEEQYGAPSQQERLALPPMEELEKQARKQVQDALAKRASQMVAGPP